MNNKLANTVIFSGIVSFLVCLVSTNEKDYSFVFVLPLLLLLLSVVFYRAFDDLSNSMVFQLIMLQSIFRYCLFPILLSLGQPLGNGEFSDYFNISITIMTIELVSAFYVLKIFSKKQKVAFLKKSSGITPLKGLLPLFVLLLFAFYYMYISGALNKINPIWDFSTYLEDSLSGDIEQSSSTLALILFTPFKALSSLLFITIIYKSKKIKINYKKWLYLIVIFISSIFIVGTSRFSVILFVLPLLTLIKNIIHESDYKQILGLTALLLVGVITITSIQKFSRYGNEIASVDIVKASSLNAYFAGPGNIAIGLQAFEKVSYYDVPMYLINDTFQNIPLLSKLTKDEYKLNNKFNQEIYGHNLYADQIVPLSVSGLFHFGVLGVFFYSSVFIAIALYMERLSHVVKFIGYKYILISLSIILSLVFMLNLGSLYAALARSFLFLFLPFLAISIFSKLKFR